jgi:hypothetical protein
MEARCVGGAPLRSRVTVIDSWLSHSLVGKGTVAGSSVSKLFLFFLLSLVWFAPLKAQDLVVESDNLFPELAHPKEDALAAIRRRDFRFLTINREMTIVPGVEDYPRTVRRYGTKFMKQPLHLFMSRSRTFSYNIRVRAYAAEYNRTLMRYLQQQQQRKRPRSD